MCYSAFGCFVGAVTLYLLALSLTQAATSTTADGVASGDVAAMGANNIMMTTAAWCEKLAYAAGASFIALVLMCYCCGSQLS